MMKENNATLNNLSKILEDSQKHIKGYIFDSLVFRYKMALENPAAINSRIREYMDRYGVSREEAAFAVQRNQRNDLMRFIEILDEGLGEHD